MELIQTDILVPAHPARVVSGSVLHIREPISFWGGVSPVSGLLTDTRSELHGTSIANAVVLIRQLRGSSSGSSVLLELIYKGLAPAALLVNSPDAILALGALAAREIDLPTPALLRLAADDQDRIPAGATVSIDQQGRLTFGS